jgi:hypothetical protein
MGISQAMANDGFLRVVTSLVRDPGRARNRV